MVNAIDDGGGVVATGLPRSTTADQSARRFFRRIEASALGDGLRLSLSTKLAYGFGAAAYGAKLQLFGLLLLFYNQLMGLPAATVSFVLVVCAAGTVYFGLLPNQALRLLLDKTLIGGLK